jgi:hypothetical protein
MVACLFWLSTYVACHHLAKATDSSAKDQFYSTVYYIYLNQICVAQRASKKCKNVKDRVISQNEYLSDSSVIFLLFMEQIMFKSHLIKSRHRVLRNKSR